MGQVKITLNLDNSLEYGNNGAGPLRIKKSGTGSGTTDANTLEFKPDGLYAQAKPGKPGSTGTGYPDRYESYDGIKSGVTTPHSDDSYPRRILADCFVHRVFTGVWRNGTVEDINIRDFDRMYPGDLVRYPDNVDEWWVYHVIVSVDNTDQHILELSRVIATIPFSATDVN